MIHTLAVHGYRSLRDVVCPIGPLTVIRGPNGSGKSNLYQAFRLLADMAQGRLISSFARLGGMASVLWAGPEIVTAAMKSGRVPVQGQARRQRPHSVMVGFAADDVSYLMDLGQPSSGGTLFVRDPQITREVVWTGPIYRPGSVQVSRAGSGVKYREGRSWRTDATSLTARDSILTQATNPVNDSMVGLVRRHVMSWRFYDSFRTDPMSPIRSPHIGSWSPALDHDGTNFVSALQTVLESGWGPVLCDLIADTFPDVSLSVESDDDGWFHVVWRQHGLLRPLSAAQLSDGTLRFLLLAVALLAPSVPELVVLNEPEASLHPDVIDALGRLIVTAAGRTQVVVVTHSDALVRALQRGAVDVTHVELEKQLGETIIVGTESKLSRPAWNWGTR